MIVQQDDRTLVSGDRERETYEGEEQYRTLFEMAPDVIYSISAENGTFTALSPAFETVTGWTVQEWLGKPFSGIVHPDDLPLAVERFQQGLRGEIPPPYELRIRSRSGTYLVGEFRSRPQFEKGRVVGKIGVARDITERKRMEDALRFLAEARGLLGSSLDYQTTLTNVARLAVRQIADWCVVDIVEEDGSVARLAVAHRDRAKEELAQEVRRRYPARPDSRGGVLSVIQSGAARLIHEISEEQLASVAQDEEHFDILRRLGFRSAMLVPLVARDQTLGAISLVSAESGHLFGPDDLAVAEDLAGYAGIAVENARLYREAQEAVKLRDEFLSIASHELRTPLTTLQLHTQQLRRALERGDIGRLTPDRMTSMLESEERQIKHLSKLINELLDVSRIAAGKIELERETLDLSGLVADVAARFEGEVAAMDTSVTVKSSGSVVGRWDRSRMDQVVTNLLSNALKYGAGSPIEVRVGSRDGTAELTIRDQGIGIAPEDLPRIFERFVRASGAHGHVGLGLGLYICRQLVEAHGGTIQATSQPGAGSTFRIQLPLIPD